MSEVDKCCCFIRLDLGCIIIGALSFFFNSLLSLLPILWLTLDSSDHHNLGVIPIEFTKVSNHIVLIIACIMGAFGVVASVALIVGMRENRPNYLLFYFSYGVMLIILAELGVLLLLLKGCWEIALALLILSCAFIHFVILVHQAYDLMLRGKHFGYNPHLTLDTESLVSN